MYQPGQFYTRDVMNQSNVFSETNISEAKRSQFPLEHKTCDVVWRSESV